jgi:hypothetical protein
MKSYFVLGEHISLKTGERITQGTILSRLHLDKGDAWVNRVYLTEDERRIKIQFGDYIPPMKKLPNLNKMEELELARLLFS